MILALPWMHSSRRSCPKVYYPTAEKIIPPPAIPQGVLATDKKINVETNKGVETVAIVYDLADKMSARHKKFIQPFRTATYEYFFDYSDHEAVTISRTLLDRGFWLDAMLDLPLICAPFPEAELTHPFGDGYFARAAGKNNSPGKVDKGRGIVTRYIAALNRFYIDAGVEKYLAENDSIYRGVVDEVKRNLPYEKLIPVMEYYYGKKNVSYTIIPSPVLPQSFGFGPRFKTQNGLKTFNIIAPRIQTTNVKEYGYGFDNAASINEICVHEFGHSFVNPLTELSENNSIIEKYAHLFEPIRKEMKKQGYTGWWTCVTEHIVRLGEIRIAYLLDEPARAERLRNNYVEKRKFIYLPALEEKIIEYEQHRDLYRSFGNFLPELLKKFSMLDSLYALNSSHPSARLFPSL